MLPEVATKVILLAGDERADAAKLSDVIHRDPVLAANVLKLVNSPMFGGRAEVVSLRQAVARLGMQALRELVLTVSVGDSVFRGELERDRLRKVWRRSLLASLCAKEIARLGRRNLETAFLCALLHGIGVPVVVGAAGEELRAHAWPRDQVDFGLLLLRFAQPVGRLVASKWNMPESVVYAIGHHADTRGADRHLDEVLTTALALHLADGFLSKLDGEERDPDVFRSHPAFEGLNLYADEVDTLLGKEQKLVQDALGLQT